MKRAGVWDKKYTSSDKSDSDVEGTDYADGSTKHYKRSMVDGSVQEVAAEGSTKRQKGIIDYEALSRHGYGDGLSVLKVPPLRVEDEKRDWSWKIETTITGELKSHVKHVSVLELR